MSVVTTTVVINFRGEWVNRFERKNTKNQMANHLADLREAYEKYGVDGDELSEAIEEILTHATW